MKKPTKRSLRESRITNNRRLDNAIGAVESTLVDLEDNVPATAKRKQVIDIGEMLLSQMEDYQEFLTDYLREQMSKCR